LKAAGPVSDSAAGVTSLLSQLILDLKDAMTLADVATWQPESILTDAERQSLQKALPMSSYMIDKAYYANWS
jgi:hypothetical protein